MLREQGASPVTHLYPILGAGFAGAPRDCLEAGAVRRGGEWEWKDYDELLAFALHTDTHI